jgi:cytosine/adenosine deaminase-related metal-dependent hydrolase
VNQVRDRRARSDSEIGQSVREGVRLARAGGTAIIGDIGGNRSLEPLKVLRQECMAGTSFLEVFGLGLSQPLTCEFLRRIAAETKPLEGGVRFALQPHAPYSCGIDVYRTATALGLPLSTHLAETRDELRFVAEASGPLRDMLLNIGVWDDTIAGYGSHPVEALAEVLSLKQSLAAHLNYIEDRHLQLLARWPITVAYCPRASAYFGHDGHRYRDMLEAGVKVALGTDSILCLDTPDRISVLDDMRLLFRRDGTDPITLLRMATINGANALEFDPELTTLRSGRNAGLLAVRIDPGDATDPLRQAMLNDEPPRWIAGPVPGNDDWVRT